MVLGDRGADRGDDLAGVDLTDPIAVDLLHNDELFGGTRSRRDREGRPPAAQQRRMTVLRRGLDVFGVIVTTTDDDEILEPSGDEQLVSELEAQVAAEKFIRRLR